MGCWNATEAYCRVFTNSSRESARRNASDLLTRADVWSEIQRRLTVRAMGPEEVLARLSEQARANQLPFIRITEDGFCFFDFSNPDAKDYFHLIKKIKTKRQRRLEGPDTWEDEWVEVELYDAQAALIQIGKYHKLFTERLEIEDNSGGLTPEQVNDRLLELIEKAAARARHGEKPSE
jgi:hypothetical protein